MSISGSEMSVADFAAVCGNGNNGNGFFGNDAWILILFLLLGWGGNRGYGGVGGGGGGCATQADVRAAVDQQTILNKLDQQTYGIADATYSLNNTINNGFYGVDRSICNLSAQLAQCCCDNRAAIADLKYQMATDTCAIQNTIQNTTRDVLDAINANYVRGLENELQSYKLSASQANQNAVLLAAMDANKAEILRRTGAECPSPAYLVNAPTPVTFPVDRCGQVQFGNGGCGGCGNF